MGTYRSRQHSDYMDPSRYEPHIWPEEETAIELLEKLQEEPSDEHRDAIVKMIGDLRTKVAQLEQDMEHVTQLTSFCSEVHPDTQQNGWAASVRANESGELLHATGATCVDAVRNVWAMREASRNSET